MNNMNNLQEMADLTSWTKDAFEYGIDAWERSIIFLDILRKRGNTYIEHLRNGQPPVLTFNYEMIMDGRSFARPVNYALVRISDRRKKHIDYSAEMNRRKNESKEAAALPKRPIVIIDPRAGHGPGIGGSSRDSEIGMALDNDHPVYFILFYTEPMPGQTLVDVEEAEVRFIEEVVKRHPHTDSPAIIGNCQAGWAAALLCADRPDITGPLVLNGAPLSYWAGVEGANPMRYKGGLAGGVWMNSLLSDLGNGKFDGANLVLNFETLNPANTLWSKNYNVYSKVDTEEERFLKFEKWWGGFFIMTSEEIHFIVNNLFVGNKLEQGELVLHRGEKISMKNIRSPILVFASRGDNITPPQQALNWILRVYSSAEEIREKGQVIIYIIHESIGHLGIFVSASIARKEHKEIISNFDMIDYLPPGLYEMVITGDVKSGDFDARFEERTFEDIIAMDDDNEEEDMDFRTVAAISDINDILYRIYARPWVKAFTTELSSEIKRWMHPLRMQRYMISDMNPMLRPLKSIASLVRQNRRPVHAENSFLAMETDMSEFITRTLNHYRDTRDSFQEQLFYLIYNSDVLHYMCLSENGECLPDSNDAAAPAGDRQQQISEVGPVAEGMIRVIIAVARIDHAISRRRFEVAETIARTHSILKKIKPSVFKRIIKEQTWILQAGEDKAIRELAEMITDADARKETLEIAERIAMVDGSGGKSEKAMLEKIQKGLGLSSRKSGSKR